MPRRSKLGLTPLKHDSVIGDNYSKRLNAYCSANNLAPPVLNIVMSSNEFSLVECIVKGQTFLSDGKCEPMSFAWNAAAKKAFDWLSSAPVPNDVNNNNIVTFSNSNARAKVFADVKAYCAVDAVHMSSKGSIIGHAIAGGRLARLKLSYECYHSLFDSNSATFRVVMDHGAASFKACSAIKNTTGFVKASACDTSLPDFHDNMIWGLFKPSLSPLAKVNWFLGIEACFGVKPFHMCVGSTPVLLKKGWLRYQNDCFGVYTSMDSVFGMPIGILIPGGAYKEYPSINDLVAHFGGIENNANLAPMFANVYLQKDKFMIFSTFEQASEAGCKTIFCAPYYGGLEVYNVYEHFNAKGDCVVRNDYRIVDDAAFVEFISYVFSMVLVLC